MRRIATLALIILCLTFFSACTAPEAGVTEYFGFEISDFKIVEEEDTHGGFLGDGEYYLILDCSDNADDAQSIIANWQKFPLPETLSLLMYGGEKDGNSYGYNFAKEAHWPDIKNGVYKFVDRQRQAEHEEDDSNLLDRGSLNFSLAVYDKDTDMLYYFELDT